MFRHRRRPRRVAHRLADHRLRHDDRLVGERLPEATHNLRGLR
ncbi:MAG TPA: hypothetical protein VF015_01730 [Acidimicrobiales bacterium]